MYTRPPRRTTSLGRVLLPFWIALPLLVAIFLSAGQNRAFAAPSGGSGITIDHVQANSDGTVDVLVSAPTGTTVDLNSVKLTVDGHEVTGATAKNASETSVDRTAVLLVDTSDSMGGAKIQNAIAAAQTFLNTAPANVKVGVVTFDKQVQVLQTPTTDRKAVTSALGTIKLRHGTALNQGVTEAVKTAGTTGSRSILLLSDGKDTTGTPIAPVLKAISKSKVAIDAVGLQQSGPGLASLQQFAQAGNGTVLSAKPTELQKAFTNEAQSLANQVVVTGSVPAGKTTDADLSISLSAGGKNFTTSAYTTVRTKTKAAAPAKSSTPVAAPANTGFNQNVLYIALAMIGVGIIGAFASFFISSTSKSGRHATTVDENLAAYGRSAERTRKSAPAPAQISFRAAAQQRAAAALASNRTLEARIAARLEAAGSHLKPAEWLLMHGAIAVGSALVLTLVGRGNILMLLIGLAVGAVAPWIWLGFKRSRRLRAFEMALPDTLTLMAGSLQAGLSLPQSVDTIVREGTDPIVSEFRRSIVETRLGVPLEDALEGIAERMQSRDFGWVVMAIRIQREVGGNLAELLHTVAATLREREYVRRHVRALSAEGRLSCYVLGGLPPAFLGFLALTKWNYVSPIFTTPIGWVLMTVMCVLLAVGIFWMSKVAKVEI